jgi:uncharacterized Zn-finger protein
MASQLRKKYTLNRDDGPQCDKCLRRFARNETLRNHKARIHDGKTSKDFECLKCHKRFSQKGHLTVHDKTVHLKLREHVCEVCGRAFGENSHFRSTFACGTTRCAVLRAFSAARRTLATARS